MVVVKRGKNPIAIVDDLDIHQLRDFQLKANNLQMQDDVFKMTPPNYNVDNVFKRIKDWDIWV